MIQHYSLKIHNTFGLDVKAQWFSTFNSTEQLIRLLDSDVIKNNRMMILGGGSNILFTKDFDGVVLKNEIPGISNPEKDGEGFLVKVGAGVPWHTLVLKMVDNNLAGIENLSLIPGNAGAAPMQNIGAYGVELKDVFHRLEAIEIATGKSKTFYHQDCQFGYRESVFKGALKEKYIITSITLKLKPPGNFNTEYGAIREELEKMKIEEVTLKAVSDAVINIRRSKLPDPAVTGNAGSFFKNPSIPASQLDALKNNFPGIISYPGAEGKVKVAAGWLIEQCGWKGKSLGNAAVHSKQALVLVNQGNAAGQEILDLSLAVKNSVNEKFEIMLETEVNIYS